MSSNAQKSTETNSSNNAPQAEPEKQNQQTLLGALEEDDEFEEFPVQDWDDSETNLVQLTGTNGDQLWEDNWDDDDIEDEFSLQLRNELGKTTKSTASIDAMQH